MNQGSRQSCQDTIFRINLDGVPDGELTKVGNGEIDSVQQQWWQQQGEAKYQTKEDRDVADFFSLAQRASSKSLLHLLEGQVRAQSLSPEYLVKYSALAESESMRTKAQKPLAKQKYFSLPESWITKSMGQCMRWRVGRTSRNVITKETRIPTGSTKDIAKRNDAVRLTILQVQVILTPKLSRKTKDCKKKDKNKRKHTH